MATIDRNTDTDPPSGTDVGTRSRPQRAGTTRRAQILDAALACFDRQGISATTIEDIRLGSGASVGSIYHHVGGRDAIVAALYLDAVSAYRTGIAAALADNDDPRAAVGAVVRFHVSWIVDHPALARLTLHWDESELGAEGRQALRAVASRFDADLVAWHRAGAATGGLAPMHEDVFAACFLGPLLEAARRLAHHRHPLDDAEIGALAAGLAERIWCGLSR